MKAVLPYGYCITGVINAGAIGLCCLITRRGGDKILFCVSFTYRYFWWLFIWDCSSSFWWYCSRRRKWEYPRGNIKWIFHVSSLLCCICLCSLRVFKKYGYRRVQPYYRWWSICTCGRYCHRLVLYWDDRNFDSSSTAPGVSKSSEVAKESERVWSSRSFKSLLLAFCVDYAWPSSMCSFLYWIRFSYFTVIWYTSSLWRVGVAFFCYSFAKKGFGQVIFHY